MFFIEGVIVHTQHIYREVPVAIGVIYVMFAIAFLLVVINVVADSYKQGSDRWRLEAIACIVLAGIWVLGGCFLIPRTQIVRNDLVVSIADSVCFNDFFKRYEIVSQDGNLYTVREIINGLGG